ncbi:MAG: gamma-glutamylcyclotransferase family protein, partial [Vicinamibacterales bacterium]
FDLGLYPAAVPDPTGEVRGEVYEMTDPEPILAALDEIEGFRPGRPDQSLYTRELTEVTLADGASATVSVYLYNAPLGQAPRIASGDYLAYIHAR